MAKATTKSRQERARAEAKRLPRAKNTGATPPKGNRRGSATKVMGLTIPKGLANVLDSLLNSRHGRELLASALVAAAGAAAAALVKSSDTRDERDPKGGVVTTQGRAETGTTDLALAAAGALAEMATRAVTGAKTKRRS
jgi:hypothetical protein